MKTIYLFIIISALLLLSCGQEGVQPTSLEEEIALIAKTHILFGRTPGIAIGVVNAQEEFNYFFGTKNLATGEAIDELTYFQIASLTKTFTATMLAEMALNNDLSLDDQANDWLPGSLQIPESFETPVRMKHLLNHTSGLEREPVEVTGESYYEFDQGFLGSYLENTQLIFEPGTDYEYSNTGFGLAGIIAEQHYQRAYKEVVKNRVFSTLGMNYTICNWADANSENIAVDYFGSRQADYENYSEAFAGAYAIKTNLHDMMIYLNAQLNYEFTSLAEPIALTREPTYELPKLSDNNEVKSKQIGLGWITVNFNDGKQYIYHNGALAGSAAFLGFNPETKEGVVVLINGFCPGNEQDRIGFEILDLLNEY